MASLTANGLNGWVRLFIVFALSGLVLTGIETRYGASRFADSSTGDILHAVVSLLPLFFARWVYRGFFPPPGSE